MRGAETEVAVVAIRHPDACALVLEGGEGMHVNDTTHRVTAIERPLRSA